MDGVGVEHSLVQICLFAFLHLPFYTFHCFFFNLFIRFFFTKPRDLSYSNRDQKARLKGFLLILKSQKAPSLNTFV